jgi:hypothetical protein
MSDTTDKAARAAYKEWRDELRFQPRDDFAAFKAGMEAGASHALSRPLTSDEAEELAREACRLMAETDTLEAHGHAIYAALQRMRSPKP